MPLVDFVPFLKICGIKRQLDLRNAIAAGANALGVIIGSPQSRRDFVDIEVASDLLRSVPPHILSVLVTLETNGVVIADILKMTGARAVQLHGEIDIDAINNLKSRSEDIIIIKAYPLRSDLDFSYGQQYLSSVDAFLVDAVNPNTGLVGGAGTVVDWDLARRLSMIYPVPMILAGGLNPTNVAEAIKQSSCIGVDVNSGVKGVDGYKSEPKVREFLLNAAEAFTAS